VEKLARASGNDAGAIEFPQDNGAGPNVSESRLCAVNHSWIDREVSEAGCPAF
jgi:hypothetical protein